MSDSSTTLVRSATSYKVTAGSTEFSQPKADGLQKLLIEDHQEIGRASV